MNSGLDRFRSFVSEAIFLPHGDKPIVRTFFKASFLLTIPKRDLFKLTKISRIVRVKPFTLLSYQRLSTLYDLANFVREKNIPGDFVECGVCNGGSAGLVADIFKTDTTRKSWLFDSWEGMPAPDLQDTDLKGRQVEKGVARGYVEKVEKLIFNILGCSRTQVQLEKGWFQNSIPLRLSAISQISLLHLDCDWYESIKFCLENLYDKVVPGGYIVIDDYGYWRGCRLAVDEFVAKNGLTQKIIPIDYSGVYIQKTMT